MLNCLCSGRFGLGWAYDAFYFAHHMLMLFTFNIFVYIWTVWDFSECFFLPPFSLYFTLMRQWHQNVNLLRPRTLFVLGHRLLLILPLPLFGFVMRMPKKTSRKTFLDEVFIRNAESFCRTSLTLIYLLSFTVGVESHCVTSRSHVHPCWSRSFTPTCMYLILQYLSFILAFEVRT